MRPHEYGEQVWVRAGKAYISSLGTTGLLIASSLLLLVVVGTFLAFDQWPEDAAADTVVVPIGADRPQRDSGEDSPPRAATRLAARRAATGLPRRPPASVRRAVAGRVAVQVIEDSDSLAAAPADPVVSDLPAPDAVAGPPPPPTPPVRAPAPAAPGPPDQPRLPVPDDVLPADGEELAHVTQPLDDTLTPALEHTEARVDSTVGGIVGLVEVER